MPGNKSDPKVDVAKKPGGGGSGGGSPKKTEKTLIKVRCFPSQYARQHHRPSCGPVTQDHTKKEDTDGVDAWSDPTVINEDDLSEEDLEIKQKMDLLVERVLEPVSSRV
jgi:hypothetical protein